MPLQTGRPDAAACARVRTNQKAVGSSRTAGVQYVRMSVHACHACTRGPCMRMHAHAGHACACMYTLAMHACTRVPCTARTHTQHLLFAHALQDRIMEDEMDRLRDAMEIAKRRHARKNACTHTDGCAHVHTMTIHAPANLLYAHATQRGAVGADPKCCSRARATSSLGPPQGTGKRCAMLGKQCSQCFFSRCRRWEFVVDYDQKECCIRTSAGQRVDEWNDHQS